ncbi:MAG TPA: NAD-dependent epimerase/dehydratase family protein [Anaeromyxobacteraceae bacterium]|nr:NAD-dependent epimerase/dehydratase family protein [Anaeromyxobacteraceae bacterium]
MRVLVTGGTGFVGAHAVVALQKRGHEVRLLVREPGRVARALGPLGARAEDVTAGDVTDQGTVETALRGCDAVLHAASVFSFDSRDAERIRATNVRGTELVLGAARRLGLDPIVYVSSVLALLPSRGAVLTPDSPLGKPLGVYSRSKGDAERVARQHQEAGAPVVVASPGSVWGPNDPHFGESSRLAAQVLKGQFRLIPTGGYPVVDVRDVAAALAAAFERGRGPRRYTLGGRFTRMTDLVGTILRLAGRQVATATVPATFALGAAWAADLAQRALPWRLPVHLGGAYVTFCAPRCDDSRAAAELGFSPRPLEDTVADSVRWLAREGRVTPLEAGALAPGPPAAGVA